MLTLTLLLAAAISSSPSPAGGKSMVQLLQFTAPYQLDQITDTMRHNMALAIADVTGLNISMIFLSFTAVNRRSRGLLQADGVQVTVDLVGFQGSTEQFQSALTQDNTNKQMVSLGLQPITLVTVGSKLAANSTTGTCFPTCPGS